MNRQHPRSRPSRTCRFPSHRRRASRSECRCRYPTGIPHGRQPRSLRAQHVQRSPRPVSCSGSTRDRGMPPPVFASPLPPATARLRKKHAPSHPCRTPSRGRSRPRAFSSSCVANAPPASGIFPAPGARKIQIEGAFGLQHLDSRAPRPCRICKRGIAPFLELRNHRCHGRVRFAAHRERRQRRVLAHRRRVRRGVRLQRRHRRGEFRRRDRPPDPPSGHRIRLRDAVDDDEPLPARRRDIERRSPQATVRDAGM